MVALVTPNYYASPFCLCETGAAWYSEKPFLPILTPPVGYSDLRGALYGKQTALLDVARDLDRAFDHWVTQTITSSMRDYWDNRWFPVDRAYVDTPTAFGVFAHQTVSEGEPPRPYFERVYNIQRWTVFPHGGHFAPTEEPAAVAKDLMTFFRDRH